MDLNQIFDEIINNCEYLNENLSLNEEQDL
ncbi:hypothetical protein HDE70_000955 [Pedobacter cryoconitis]|nr:hypothetical protein [Pedobacter cryoconitis]